MPNPKFKRCWLIFEISGPNGTPVYRDIAFTAKDRDEMLRTFDFIPKSGRFVAQEYRPSHAKMRELHR